MKKVITSLRSGISNDCAEKVATDVARSLGFEIQQTVARPRSKQLVFFVPDQEPATLRRFTMMLRVEHKDTLSSVSAAQKA